MTLKELNALKLAILSEYEKSDKEELKYDKAYKVSGNTTDLLMSMNKCGECLGLLKALTILNKLGEE